jgi:hypothetical protein
MVSACGGKTARHIASQRIRPATARIHSRGTAPLRMIVTLFSVPSRVRRASSGFGWATMRTYGRVMNSSRKTFRLAGRSCIPMRGRVTVGVTPSMRPSATASTHGPGMMTGTADARSTATPVKGQAGRSVPICVPSVRTYTSMWRPMKRWSMRNASPPS